MTTTSKFTISVHNGDERRGAMGSLHCVLWDSTGLQSERINLQAAKRVTYPRSTVDTYQVSQATISSLDQSKQIAKIHFVQDGGGPGCTRYVTTIVAKAGGTKSVFPLFRWLRPSKVYVIQREDTALPQEEKEKEERARDLREKRENYQLSQKLPHIPIQIKDLPEDENFSWTDETTLDLPMSKLRLALRKTRWFVSGKVRGVLEHWGLVNLPDINTLYDSVYIDDALPKPKGVENWSDDVTFGRQRLSGANSGLIELCTAIPDKLAVDEDMLKPSLEGLNVQQALDAKRLFLCDLHILQGLWVQPGFVLCAPIALFFLDKKDQLKPIAIQLFQTPRKLNPVFLPTDDKNLWTLVKMWFNNADAAYHQAVAHLGSTHLIMEGPAVVTHRQLSQSHPIFKLLAPHFLNLLAINTNGVPKLINRDNGHIDVLMSYGISGLLQLVSRCTRNWRLDVEGTLPADLKRRGLNDPKVLPGYHFREDAMLLYDAIHKYVTKYVNLYYDTPEKLKDDHEIQAWASDLVQPKDHNRGGCGLKGVPGGGQLTETQQLVTILCSFIYTCSVAHAAVNFPQYDQYAFPPNYPGILHGEPPQCKEAITEADIRQALTDISKAETTMILTRVLSRMGTNSLGDFETEYIYDPKGRFVWRKFQEDLVKVGEEIDRRNKERTVPYTYLHPKKVPNSISI